MSKTVFTVEARDRALEHLREAIQAEILNYGHRLDVVFALPSGAMVQIAEPKPEAAPKQWTLRNGPVSYTNDSEARARATFAWHALQSWWNEPQEFGIKPRAQLGWIGSQSRIGDVFKSCIVAIWDTSDDRTTALDRVLAAAPNDQAIARQVLRAYQGWTP